MSRYPFTPYPSGWYRVAHAAELQGTPLLRFYFGRDLLITRAHDGQPKVANVRTKEELGPTLEQDGLVFVYFDTKGRPPAFQIPTVPETQEPGWSAFHRYSFRPRVHIQEIAENALDLPHFHTVHDNDVIPRLNRFDIEGKTFSIGLTTQRIVMGVPGQAELDISYHGLGVVHSRVRAIPFALAVILTSTPIDTQYVDIEIAVMHNRANYPLFGRLASLYINYKIPEDFRHDVPIWENKTYLQHPRLCRDDGPIMKIRQWASQFYDDATARAG